MDDICRGKQKDKKVRIQAVPGNMYSPVNNTEVLKEYSRHGKTNNGNAIVCGKGIRWRWIKNFNRTRLVTSYEVGCERIGFRNLPHS